MTTKLDSPSGNLIRDLSNGRRVLIRRGAQCEVRAAENDDDRVVEFVASTEGVKRDGHEVMARGFDFTNFDKNPVFLWGHDQGSPDRPPLPPIGSVIDRKVEADDAGARLVIRVKFAEHELADTVFRLYRDKHMRSVSIGWLPIKTEPTKTGVRFLESELLEVSAVPVPADPDATMRHLRTVSDEIRTCFARATRSDGNAYMLDARDPLTGDDVDDDDVVADIFDDDIGVDVGVDGGDEGAPAQVADDAEAADDARADEADDAETRAEDDDAEGDGSVADDRDDGAEGNTRISLDEVQPLVGTALEIAESIEALNTAVADDDDAAAMDALGMVAEKTATLADLASNLMPASGEPESDDDADDADDEDGERSAAAILKSLLEDAEARVGTKIAKKRHDVLNRAKDCLREASDLIDDVMSESQYAEDADDAERSAPVDPDDADIEILARILGVNDAGPDTDTETDEDEVALAALADLLDD